MRSGEIFHTSMTTAASTATARATFSPPAIVQRSPWHSPVPYLFGGLAAMLGLIAFALLILACSYWKLSGRLEDGERQDGDGDLEGGDGQKPRDGAPKAMPVFEEKIVVIMAGDVKPTFLAMPTSNRASTAGDCDGKSEKNETEKAEIAEKPKINMGDDEQNHS